MAVNVEDLLSSFKGQSSIVILATALFTGYVAYEFAKAIYNAFFGPLAKFPGPLIRKFTIIPHAWAIAHGNQHRDILALHEKYGTIIRYGPRHVMFANSKDSWKDVYGFRKGGTLPKDPVMYGFSVNGAHSIVTAHNADHQRQRKVFSNAFSDRALKAQESMIQGWAAKLVSKLKEVADTGEKTDLLKWFNCTTFDVMADLTFGDPLNMLESSEYVPWVKTIFNGIKSATIMRSIKHLGSIPYYLIDDVLMKQKFVRARVLEHWRYSADRVDKRMEKGATKPDIWSLLENKDREHGGLSRLEQHANGNLFMIAGTETTATALSGIYYLMVKNPKALEKLTTEIRTEFNSIEDLALERLARCKFLHAVIEEGLRLYPPAPIDLPRYVPKEGAFVEGHFLPAGTKVAVQHYATYRLPQHFKNPNEFHPERWLGDPEYKDDNLDMFEPFSTGPRNCLGKNLAYHEMRLLFAAMILNFDVNVLPESGKWVEDQHVYSLWEKTPLWVTLKSVKA